MRVTWHEASGWTDIPGKGRFRDRYAPHAFDRVIGATAPFKLAGVAHGVARVVAVVVDEDGLGATWTADIPDIVAPRPPGGVAMSFTPVPEQDVAAAWLDQVRAERGW
jgi:hypothetical protein